MEALAAKTEGLSKTDRMQLDFALGKAYADLKDYSPLVQALCSPATPPSARRSPTTSNSAFALFDQHRSRRSRRTDRGENPAAAIRPRCRSSCIGMPRSGTTLVEQIIASHPLVHGAGELQTFNDVVLTVRGPDGNTIPIRISCRRSTPRD